MGFTEFEANEENPPLVFSDDEDQITNDEIDDFIDDTDKQREGISFYRQLDPENIKHYPKFRNQTRNPNEAVYEDDKSYYGGEDTQPELCDPENRDFVNFDKFAGFEKSVQKFKETLKNFDRSENSLFDAIIYGAMYYKSDGKVIDKNNVREVLEDNFYNDLLEIKDDIKLDRTIFGYFDRCFQANEILSQHNFFLKFFE